MKQRQKHSSLTLSSITRECSSSSLHYRDGFRAAGTGAKVTSMPRRPGRPEQDAGPARPQHLSSDEPCTLQPPRSQSDPRGDNQTLKTIGFLKSPQMFPTCRHLTPVGALLWFTEPHGARDVLAHTKLFNRSVTTESVPWLPLPSPQVRKPLGKACIPTGSRLKQQSPHSKKVNRSNEGEFLPFKTSPFLPDGDQYGKFRAALQVYYDLGTKGLVQKLPKMHQEAPDSNLSLSGWAKAEEHPATLAAGTGMSTHSSAHTDPQEFLFQRKMKKDPHSSCGLPGSSIMLLQNRYNTSPKLGSGISDNSWTPIHWNKTQKLCFEEQKPTRMTFFCSEFWSGSYVEGENWLKEDKKLKKKN